MPDRPEVIAARPRGSVHTCGGRKTWPALEKYRKLEPQTEWWSGFVRDVLGRDNGAMPTLLMEDPTVITE